MIKNPKNGLPNSHTGACPTLAHLAVSSVGTEVSLSPQCHGVGDLVPHALIQTMNTKIRKPGAQRTTGIHSDPLLCF